MLLGDKDFTIVSENTISTIGKGLSALGIDYGHERVDNGKSSFADLCSPLLKSLRGRTGWKISFDFELALSHGIQV
jgi:hypothetical protein